MQYLILDTDQTETPDDAILGGDFYGEYHLFCTAYGSTVVNFQFYDEDTDTWLNASRNGDLIQLTRAGDVALVDLAQGVNYRVQTDAVGAKVKITRGANRSVVEVR